MALLGNEIGNNSGAQPTDNFAESEKGFTPCGVGYRAVILSRTLVQTTPDGKKQVDGIGAALGRVGSAERAASLEWHQRPPIQRP